MLECEHLLAAELRHISSPPSGGSGVESRVADASVLCGCDGTGVPSTPMSGDDIGERARAPPMVS